MRASATGWESLPQEKSAVVTPRHRTQARGFLSGKEGRSETSVCRMPSEIS